MNRLLEDVRLLKLAEAREAAFAAFLVELGASCIHDPAFLARLHGLLCAAEARRAGLARHLQRLNDGIPAARPDEVERAALLDLSEAARGDAALHRDLAPRLHDAAAAEALRVFAHVRQEESALLALLAEGLPAPGGLAAGIPPPPGRSRLHPAPRKERSR